MEKIFVRRCKYIFGWFNGGNYNVVCELIK